MASASDQNLTGKRPKGCYESGVDRLSDLPDAMVSHILSFLSTEVAVATSFLSKTWKLRWTKLLNTLVFDDGLWISRGGAGGTGQKTSFDQFVNMVLLKHSAESIHKFALIWYHSKFQSFYLNLWVDTVIARNIRVMDIDVGSDRGVENPELNLPAAFYSCGTLEVLRLSGNLLLKLPYVVCFPKVTVLELHSVKHESDESFHKIISGCPRLQTLSFHLSYYDSVRVYTISSPTLKHLDLNFIDEDDIEGINLKVNIKTPALESIVVFDLVGVEYSILGPTSVNEASLDMSGGIVELVQSFDRLEFLDLTEGSMYVVELLNGPNPFSTSFERLTKLDVEVAEVHWSCLLNLIDCCISLEVLMISKSTHRSKCWIVPVNVPRCFSSSLRHVSFSGFYAVEDDMGMLKLITEHGLRIETITLSTKYSAYPITCDEKFQILNKASQLPRASPACKISFSSGCIRCPARARIM